MTRVLFYLPFLLCFVFFVWGSIKTQQLQSQFQLACDEKKTCQKLAEDIELLRTENARSVGFGSKNHDSANDIFRELDASRIAKGKLVANSVGEFDSKTELQKKVINQPIATPVTIAQLISFLQKLDSLPVTYYTDSILLTRPTQEQTPTGVEKWNVKMKAYYFEKHSSSN